MSKGAATSGPDVAADDQADLSPEQPFAATSHSQAVSGFAEIWIKENHHAWGMQSDFL